MAGNNGPQKNDTAYIKLLRLNRRIDSLAHDASIQEPAHKKMFSQMMDPNLLRGSKKYIFCRIDQDDYKELQKKDNQHKANRMSAEKLEQAKRANELESNQRAILAEKQQKKNNVHVSNKVSIANSFDFKENTRDKISSIRSSKDELSEAPFQNMKGASSQIKDGKTNQKSPDRMVNLLSKEVCSANQLGISSSKFKYLDKGKVKGEMASNTTNLSYKQVSQRKTDLKSEMVIPVGKKGEKVGKVASTQEMANISKEDIMKIKQKNMSKVLDCRKESIAENLNQSKDEKKSFLEGLISKKFNDMQDSVKYRMDNLRHFESHRLQSFHQRKHNLLKLNSAMNFHKVSNGRKKEESESSGSQEEIEEDINRYHEDGVVNRTLGIHTNSKTKMRNETNNNTNQRYRTKTVPTERNEGFMTDKEIDSEKKKPIKLKDRNEKIQHTARVEISKITKRATVKAKSTAKSAAMIGSITKMITFLEGDKELQEHKMTYRQKIQEFHKEFTIDNHKQTDSISIQDHENLQYYKVCKILGEGASSTVQLVLDTRTNQKYAMKVYTKKSYNDTMKDHIVNEAKLLEKCSHSSIIKLIEWFEGHRKVYLILEYVGPTTLGEYLESKKSEKGALDEDEACHIFYEIALGLLYLHSKGIFHRDIKIHNVIIGSKSEVKLIDLGYAVELPSSQLITTFCGTPSYMAPEIIARKPYNPEKSDIWSFGICLFRVLCGRMPFTGVSQTNLFYHIKKGDFQFSKSISTPVKSLVLELLNPQPDKRPSIKDLLKRSWFVAITPESTADLG